MLFPRQFQIKSSLFSGRKQLTVDPLYIEWSNYFQEPFRFTKENIEAFRYGVEIKSWYAVVFSRTYALDIKDHRGMMIRIRFYGLFGVGKKRLLAKFSNIIQAIHENFFQDMLLHYVRLLNERMTFVLADSTLSPDGICLNGKKDFVPWNRVGLKVYHHSCTLYDQGDPNQYRAFDYGHDWNADILRSIADYAIKKANKRRIV